MVFFETDEVMTFKRNYLVSLISSMTGRKKVRKEKKKYHLPRY